MRITGRVVGDVFCVAEEKVANTCGLIISPHTGRPVARIMHIGCNTHPTEAIRRAAERSKECGGACVELHYCGCLVHVDGTIEAQRHMPELRAAYEAALYRRQFAG